MKVKDLIKRMHSEDLMGRSVQIKKIKDGIEGRVHTPNEKMLEGMTGTLTNNFSSFHVTGIGIFLDDCALSECNLHTEDQIELI